MMRWLTVLTFLVGVGASAYFSSHDQARRTRPVTGSGEVHSAEDGGGIPTPRPN